MNSTVAPAVETQDLRKEFGNVVALQGLNLRVEPGEVFGFLGPNGAGKTTAVKILAGLAFPTSGYVRVFGGDPRNPLVRADVGFLPEHFRFQEWLTGAELLDFHARLGGQDRKRRHQRVKELLSLVGLAEAADRPLRAYSKGMLQRVGIAQALVHQPRLVILDEPTSALDPLGRREVRDLIGSLRREGTTVFLNSHLLSEVEMVCDRVAIVDRGVVVKQGSLAELLRGEAELTLRLDRVSPELLDDLGRLGRVLAVRDREVVLGVADLEVAPRVARLVVERGFALYGLVPAVSSLEDVFVQSLMRHPSDDQRS